MSTTTYVSGNNRLRHICLVGPTKSARIIVALECCRWTNKHCHVWWHPPLRLTHNCHNDIGLDFLGCLFIDVHKLKRGLDLSIDLYQRASTMKWYYKQSYKHRRPKQYITGCHRGEVGCNEADRLDTAYQILDIEVTCWLAVISCTTINCETPRWPTVIYHQQQTDKMHNTPSETTQKPHRVESHSNSVVELRYPVWPMQCVYVSSTGWAKKTGLFLIVNNFFCTWHTTMCLISNGSIFCP